MLDRLIILDSNKTKSEALASFLSDLKKNNFDLTCLSANETLSEELNKNNIVTAKTNWPPFVQGFWQIILTLPLYLFFLLSLWLKNKKYKDYSIISLGLTDTILAAALSAISNKKHFWLLLPENQHLASQSRYLTFLTKKTQIFTYSSSNKKKLEKAGFKAKINLLLPSLAPQERKLQENLFATIARAERPKRKFFTVGTIASITKESHLETLLKAAKEAKEVIPNLQIIIVGDGPEKKNLQWMTKQLGIETTVWFVGPTEQTFKWLDNLDLYIVAKPSLSLKEQIFVLEIMSRKLPVIADSESGLADIVFENKTGRLLDFKNAANLSQAIINLEQNTELRLKMGIEAQKRSQELFSPQKALDQFIKFI